MIGIIFVYLGRMAMSINWILLYVEVSVVRPEGCLVLFGVVKVKSRKLCWAGYVDRMVIKQ